MSRIAFTFDDPGGGFRCRLACGQCVQIKANGQQCQNRVCLGFPICWIHTKQVYGVKTGPSTIPNAEKGLFATRFHPSGSFIVPYVGEIINQQCLDLRYPGNATAPYTSRDANGLNYVDSACMRGTGSRANGIFNPRTGRSRPRNQHNADIQWNPADNELWLRAFRDIRSGDEIMVYYGNSYILQDNHTTSRTKAPDTRPC